MLHFLLCLANRPMEGLQPTSAASSNTATREKHCNKLLFINSLFLIIFNNLYILRGKGKILAFQQESAYLYTGE